MGSEWRGALGGKVLPGIEMANSISAKRSLEGDMGWKPMLWHNGIPNRNWGTLLSTKPNMDNRASTLLYFPPSHLRVLLVL